MLLLFVYSSDPILIFLFLMLPMAGLLFFVLILAAIPKRTRRRSISLFLAVVVFLFTSGAMLKTQNVLRPSLRWLLWSRHLKAEVLAQSSANEELRHVEWDGWGGAPVGDWTVYVVYDPTDSLSDAVKSGRQGTYQRYKGIPCEVESVRRLESQWYSVVLGMNEWWDRCNSSILLQRRDPEVLPEISAMYSNKPAHLE
jgi:hypothetical protein